jgi:hypothetical protein
VIVIRRDPKTLIIEPNIVKGFLSKRAALHRAYRQH